MTTNLTVKMFDKAAIEVARDAYLAGDETKATKILKDAGVTLNRTQVKQIARYLVASGAIMLATKLLTGAMSRDSAFGELAPAPTATVGMILYTSWGWEQTNVDFYEVVAVKGASVKVREIGGRCVGGGRGSDQVVATPGAFIGAETTHRIGKSHDGTLSIKIDDHHAWVWDGKPQYQTASGCGH